LPDERTPTPERTAPLADTANEPGNGCPFIQVESLVCGYGKKEVLNSVSISVAAGEIVAVIGHNGAGKSTLLKAIFGMIPLWAGRVLCCGEEIERPEPRRWLARGVAYMPQGNRVFGDLSVRENLEVSAISIRGKANRRLRVDQVLSHYSQLRDRLHQRAYTLSGGEKQMLALASVFVLSPRALLLDEPSLGLAPPLVTEALRRIRVIAQKSGASIVVVEQKVREVLKIADRVYVLRNGRVSFSGRSSDIADDALLKDVYL